MTACHVVNPVVINALPTFHVSGLIPYTHQKVVYEYQDHVRS